MEKIEQGRFSNSFTDKGRVFSHASLFLVVGLEKSCSFVNSLCLTYAWSAVSPTFTPIYFHFHKVYNLNVFFAMEYMSVQGRSSGSIKHAMKIRHHPIKTNIVVLVHFIH